MSKIRTDPGQSVKELVGGYIASLPEPKRRDMLELHSVILKTLPGCRLRYLDGMNDEGKVVSNPNIGYGSNTTKYADGSTKEFYKIGLSANTAGISVYVLGVSDKKFLAEKFGKTIGKASVTGYCIKFKKLADIRVEVLQEAIRSAVEAP